LLINKNNFGNLLSPTKVFIINLNFMIETSPKPEQHQRPADYDEVLRNFRRRGTHEDVLVRLELLEMARGGNPRGGNSDTNFKGIRTEFYPGWRDEDFKSLLADLGYLVKE